MRTIINAQTGEVTIDESWTPLPAPTPEEVLAQAREAASLDRYTFARRAAVAGFVTFPEAAAWANGLALPAVVETEIAKLPAEQQDVVRFDVMSMPTIHRNGSLMPAVVAAFDADEAAMDALFGIGV